MTRVLQAALPSALISGEKHLLEMVASGHPLPVVLQELCRLVEELESGYLCSILLVDPRAAVFQQDELVKLWREHDRTVVMVTHDLDEAVFLADRVVVLSERPSRVRTIIPIDLPAEREERSRASPPFRECVEQIWESLRA